MEAGRVPGHLLKMSLKLDFVKMDDRILDIADCSRAAQNRVLDGGKV